MLNLCIMLNTYWTPLFFGLQRPGYRQLINLYYALKE